MARSDRFSLYVDIGTNGEMAIGNARKMWCCATAAGPAFEGAGISCGTGGVEGAVSRFGDGWYATIGKAPPVGICGSGILEIVALLVEKGVIDEGGYMAESFVVERKEKAGVDHDIVVTPGDVRKVQLAKAAVRAGIEIMLKETGVSAGSIHRVYLAGAFGNSMDIDSAAAIGMLPEQLAGRAVQAGNAAGAGARLALRSLPFERELDALRGRMSYVELSMRKDFNDAYVNALAFGRA
jgi:uncharacterized 2Fe-2S/4Fe-4S cluster protein (DUF4445 family)